MMRWRVAANSLLNRRLTVLLTLFSLTISIMLVLGINHIRAEVKQSFNNTLSGTDLIVGARGGSLNLLLYSVFHMGNATQNVRWITYEELAKHSQVEWLIPLALGDSHKGHRVVATTKDFFNHYAYGEKQALGFVEGEPFAGVFEVVIGSAVARKLGYRIGDNIIVAHGVAEISLAKHDDAPFVVSGILAPTGTPVDKSLYISLAGIEAIHRDWQSGVRVTTTKSGDQHHHEVAADAHPNTLSAILVGLKNRAAIFSVQRQINQYSGEPLQAIVPGLALAELWQILGSVETAFNVIAWLVVLASLLGMTTSLLTALNERQREFAILRSLGAGPVYLFILIISEVFLLCLLAIVLAIVLLTTSIALLQSWLVSAWGLQISLSVITPQQLEYLGVMFVIALVMAAIPSLIASRRSLGDGLSMRH